MCIAIFKKCTRYSRHIFMKTWFSETFSEIPEISNLIKFHEIPSRGKRVVPCRRTDITKLVVPFPYYANAPKNSALHSVHTQTTKDIFWLARENFYKNT